MTEPAERPAFVASVKRRCRHCYADITTLPVGAWADADGFTFCAKGVPHEPLEVEAP